MGSSPPPSGISHATRAPEPHHSHPHPTYAALTTYLFLTEAAYREAIQDDGSEARFLHHFTYLDGAAVLVTGPAFIDRATIRLDREARQLVRKKYTRVVRFEALLPVSPTDYHRTLKDPVEASVFTSDCPRCTDPLLHMAAAIHLDLPVIMMHKGAWVYGLANARPKSSINPHPDA